MWKLSHLYSSSSRRRLWLAPLRFTRRKRGKRMHVVVQVPSMKKGGAHKVLGLICVPFLFFLTLLNRYEDVQYIRTHGLLGVFLSFLSLETGHEVYECASCFHVSLKKKVEYPACWLKVWMVFCPCPRQLHLLYRTATPRVSVCRCAGQLSRCTSLVHPLGP